MAKIESQNGNRNSQTMQDGSKLDISAELVQQVSDRVYQLWRDDLRLEYERRRMMRESWRRR